MSFFTAQCPSSSAAMHAQHHHAIARRAIKAPVHQGSLCLEVFACSLIFGSMLGIAQLLRGDEHFDASVSRRPSHEGRNLCPGRAPRLKVLSQGKAH